MRELSPRLRATAVNHNRFVVARFSGLSIGTIATFHTGGQATRGTRRSVVVAAVRSLTQRRRESQREVRLFGLRSLSRECERPEPFL